MKESQTSAIRSPPVGPPVRFTFRYNSRDPYGTEGTFGGYYWNGLWNTKGGRNNNLSN